MESQFAAIHQSLLFFYHNNDGKIVTIKGAKLPRFSSAFPTERFSIPSINSSYFSTISTHNRHFRQRIMAQITSNSMSFGDGNKDCGNIDISRHTTINYSNNDAKIMRWLSPLEPDSRHHSVRTNRHGGVGDWLLETSEFREWRRGGSGADKAVLFCSGNPGVGKTHLSKWLDPLKKVNITNRRKY